MTRRDNGSVLSVIPSKIIHTGSQPIIGFVPFRNITTASAMMAIFVGRRVLHAMNSSRHLQQKSLVKNGRAEVGPYVLKEFLLAS